MPLESDQTEQPVTDGSHTSARAFYSLLFSHRALMVSKPTVSIHFVELVFSSIKIVFSI